MLRNYMPKLSLMGYLGMVPFSKMVEKRSFGKSTIRLGKFLIVASYLYEVGAIIGNSYINKLQTLWQMFDVEPTKVSESIRFFQDEAKKRIDSYGKEPDSFANLFWATELSKMGLTFEFSPKLTQALDEKMPVEQAEPLTKMWGTEGIGFGSKYPDLTGKMLKNQYDANHSDTRFDMILHGSSILPKSPISSTDKEKEVENIFKSYVNEYFPILLTKFFPD